MPTGFIPPHGGYKKLKSYQKALIVYDATLYFCGRFFSANRRQTDQMEQAARSGKQNIAEGSLASATSKEIELRLTNVAKASLGELQEDYEDFLRNRHLPAWDKDQPMAQRLTALSRTAAEVYATYRDGIESESAEVSANTIRHLIIQTMYLLDRQIRRLEQDFLRDGGIRERMTAARQAARAAASPAPGTTDLSSPSSSSSESSPAPGCPRCGAPMVQRQARSGAHAGTPFWGCSRYPGCRGTRPVQAPPAEDTEDGEDGEDGGPQRRGP